MKRKWKAAQEEHSVLVFTAWVNYERLYKNAQVGNMECSGAEIGGNIWSCFYNSRHFLPGWNSNLWALSEGRFFSSKVIRQMQ